MANPSKIIADSRHNDPTVGLLTWHSEDGVEPGNLDRVAKLVSASFGGTESDWPEQLVWSNFYRLAERNPKGLSNPSTELAKAQRSMCVDLFLAEVKAFQPARIVLATKEWRDAVIPGSRWTEAEGRFIYRYGRVEGVPAVIVPHPTWLRYVRPKWDEAKREAIVNGLRLAESMEA